MSAKSYYDMTEQERLEERAKPLHILANNATRLEIAFDRLLKFKGLNEVQSKQIIADAKKGDLSSLDRLID
ncbi:hypothetical protein [Thalassotalea piscium]|uniref:Uncharacterized protein n=1 Tax=Thalassotalea piscium TaxID=1230533 RepID=A0A7X0NJW2_9GAMM|nr:hypothetical protein [Thalassotalea piscium]MBB6544760.1 hypothetical protein [Thalassotalea piscium]